MDDVLKILSDEKARLKNLENHAGKHLEDTYSVALIQKTVKDQNGEERLINYIDLDRFSPEQKQQFDFASTRYKEIKGIICVFDNFVKSMALQSTIQSYSQYVTPLEEFKDITIPCSNIEMDKNGKFTKYSVRVGPYYVDSPCYMSFEQYTQLYTSSLSQILINSLGNNLTHEQAMQEIVRACSQIYLNPVRIEDNNINQGVSK